MKKSALFFACFAVLALAGCATAPEQRSPTEVDMKYVNIVEHHARDVGVEVQWVNPPRQRRAVKKDG